MSIQSEVITFINGIVGLSSLIDGRVYPRTAPQDATLPLITWQRVDKKDTYSHDGNSNLSVARFQFNLWAKKYSECEVMASFMRTGFAGKRNAMGSFVTASFVENEIDDYADEEQVYRIIFDVRLWYA